MKKRIFFLLMTVFILTMQVQAFADNKNIVKKPQTAYDGSIDFNAKCSMSLKFGHNETAITQEPVELYRIASFNEDCTYALTAEFKPTKLPVNGELSKSELSLMRTTISNYIDSNDITPYKIAFTNEEGKVTFGDLEVGLYFTSAVNTVRGDVKYSFDSVLTSLPSINERQLVYDVDVNTKPYEMTAPGRTSRYKIAKLWKDEGLENFRPKSIVVDIYKNGELQETVTLNQDNNWYYSWKADNDGSNWSVAERGVTDNYIPLVEERLMAFSMINTEKSLLNPPEEPDLPDVPDTSTGDTSNIGMYVLIMCVSGVLLIFVSFASKKSTSNEA